MRLLPAVSAVCGTLGNATRKLFRWAFVFLTAISLLFGATPTPVISTDRFTYLPSEPVVATFSGGPGNPKDWVGIYSLGTEPGSSPPLAWSFLDGTQTGTEAYTQGTVTFPQGVNSVGEHVVYFLLNNTYTKLAETRIRVVDPSFPLVRAGKGTYLLGETISVGFTNGPANARDWIGIYPSDRLPGSGTAVVWFYVDGTHVGTIGRSQGAIDFTGGLVAPGSYGAYLLENDGHTVLASDTFLVKESASPGPRVLSIQPAPQSTGVAPIIEFKSTVTNGLAVLVPNSVTLAIDDSIVAFNFQQEGGLSTLTYTNETLLAPSSAHTYLLSFADDAIPPGHYSYQGQFVVADYREILLPAPIFLESFDTTEEGQLPWGWTSESYSVVEDESLDLQNLNSKAYANWLVLGRDRFQTEFLGYSTLDPVRDYERVLSVNPSNVVNGRFVRDLISGGFIFGNSGYRDGGSQYLTLQTPDFDLSGRTNLFLFFHSIWEQNQDSLGAVEYSTNGGQTWLPIVYYLHGDDVLTDAQGNIDAVATFSAAHDDTARYVDPDSGAEKGATYGDFIGAAVGAELTPFISARRDDDPVESKRVELFRLPAADGQGHVRFRFAHAGTDSWYFGIDDFGLYSISGSVGDAVSLEVSRREDQIVISWPANVVGYTLESTDSLTAPSWTAVSGVVNNSVSVASALGQTFYRLRKPPQESM